MIKYRLRCTCAHEFEAWFQSSAAYDGQVAAEQVACPHCGSHDVDKAIMTPNVAARGDWQENSRPTAAMPAELSQLVRDIRQLLIKNAEYVGTRFVQEARKIHYQEAKARGIYGQASGEEARALVDEGIDILALPALPEDAN
ncbi:MAG: DUF1178 family protein [Hyphomicrobium sp.]